MRPSTVEEAASFLAAATAEGRHVRIGTDLTLERLDRMLEHEAGDLTCAVEAGIRISALQHAVAPAGQRLSLDPPGDPTVGACLAARLSGPLSHRFGTPRDLVLGVTLVLGDGTIASSGGKVVKNVAGYDLGKLVCGSEGRLALIVRVALRLHPRPAASETLVVEDVDTAGVVQTLRRSQLEPSALDVLHPGRVAVLFEGRRESVAAQLATATELVGGVPAGAAVWDEARERQGRARGRVVFAPGDLRRVLSSLDDAVVRPAAGIAYVPHAVERPPSPTVDRLRAAIVAQLDPAGVLA